MNTQINELIELFQQNNVTTVKQGLVTLETFFEGFTFHPMKEEFINLPRQDKKELVKSLLNNIKNESETVLNDDTNESSSEIAVNQNSDLNRSESFLNDDNKNGLGEHAENNNEVIEDNNTNENMEDNTSNIVSTESQTDNTSESSEDDLGTLLEEDRKYYMEQRDELLQKLQEVNEKLRELGLTDSNVEGNTKMDQARNWIKNNPGCTRKDFMDGLKDLGSKPMLSTYWQKLKAEIISK
ncbi:hypothetical protein [Methylobacter sp.]|uniref:hypothetical protein n=1 Tax=Methylobacter sp. TaxID=2051955 RepID=UPI003DA4A6D4